MLISNTSNVRLTDGQAERRTSNASSNLNKSYLITAGLSVVLATIFAGWIWNGGVITIFEILVWRPLTFLIVLMGASLWWSKRNSISLSDSLNDLLSSVPKVLVFALVVSFIPLWKVEYGSLPMGLGDIGLYIVSLGLAPRFAGPDILLRGFAWGVAIYAGIKTYRDSNDIGMSLLDFLVIWVCSSAVLLLPWLAFWTMGLANGAGLAGGAELMRAFSQSAFDSYWGNLQIVRWFLGFGEQLSHSMSLLLSSFFFILVALYSVLVFKNRIWQITKKITWENYALIGLALATGLISGWGRSPWAGIDVWVWLVFGIVVICANLLFQAWAEKDTEIFCYTLAAGLVGAFILGWPVFAAFLVVIFAALMFGGSQSLYGLFFYRILLFLAFLGLGMAFARRGDVASARMLSIAAAMFLLCLPALFPKQVVWLKRAGAWLAASLVASLLIQSFVPLAVCVLAVAVWHGLQNFKPNWDKYLPHLIYVCVLIVLIIGIWAPRLMNPKLLVY